MGLAVKHALRGYMDFGGRATRAEFWWWALAWVLVFVGANVLASLIERFSASWGFLFWICAALDWFVLAFLVATLLPSMAVTARRLHDTGRSGWWLAVWLVALASSWISFGFAFISALGSSLAFGDANWGPVIAEEAAWRFWPGRYGGWRGRIKEAPTGSVRRAGLRCRNAVTSRRRAASAPVRGRDRQDGKSAPAVLPPIASPPVRAALSP